MCIIVICDDDSDDDDNDDDNDEILKVLVENDKDYYGYQFIVIRGFHRGVGVWY